MMLSPHYGKYIVTLAASRLLIIRCPSYCWMVWIHHENCWSKNTFLEKGYLPTLVEFPRYRDCHDFLWSCNDDGLARSTIGCTSGVQIMDDMKLSWRTICRVTSPSKENLIPKHQFNSSDDSFSGIEAGDIWEYLNISSSKKWAGLCLSDVMRNEVFLAYSTQLTFERFGWHLTLVRNVHKASFLTGIIPSCSLCKIKGPFFNRKAPPQYRQSWTTYWSHYEGFDKDIDLLEDQINDRFPLIWLWWVSWRYQFFLILFLRSQDQPKVGLSNFNFTATFITQLLLVNTDVTWFPSLIMTH